jgi:hypothetical protein
LLAAEVVSSTNTSNADFEVAEPAPPTTNAAAESANASATAVRLIVPPLRLTAKA